MRTVVRHALSTRARAAIRVPILRPQALPPFGRLPRLIPTVGLCAVLAVQGRLAVAAAASGVSVVPAASAVSADRPLYDFDIPREPLRDALQAFALLSDHRLFYRSSIVAGMVGPPLKGQFALEQGIAKLLEGTDLSYEVTRSGVVLITRAHSSALPRWGANLVALLSGLMSGGRPRALTRSGAASNASQSSRGLPVSERLQEVTVTAARRTQAQLEVPMSITVISAPTAQQQEVQTFDDFAVQVPNLSVNYSQGGNVDNRGVAIRGIEGTNTTGFYLDDLPMPISLDPRVVDIDRIEVLEGPQGTLYGARSMGGTIREISTAPDLARFSGIADAQGTKLDGGSGGYLGYLTLNAPIVTGTLALRITPYRGQDGGWITRAWPVPGYTPGAAPAGVQNATPYDCVCTPGRQRDAAQTGYDGLNAQLLWQPASGLQIRPKLLYQKAAANGLPLGNDSADNTTNYMHFDIPEGTLDQFLFYGGTVDDTTPIGTFTSATSALDRHERDDEDVSEFTAFGYGTPLLPSPLASFTNAHDITQELRFASGWRSALTFTGGLYYERNNLSTAFNQYIAGFTAFYGTNVVASLWNPTVTTQKAVYGELTYHFTARWSVTLGQRYSQDTYRANGKLWGAIGFPTGLTYASGESLATGESDSVFTPRYVVQYQANADLNLYADAAKGFRPGAGQPPPGLNLCAADYAADHLTPQELSAYGPDWVWNYELGEKAFFDNRRFALNGSLFWINWTNIQEYLMFLCGEGGVINSGRAVSKGAQMDFSAVPLEGLTLNGGIGYDYARIMSPGPLISVPPAGSPIQEVAPLTANLAGQYQHPWGPNLQWLFHMDWSYTAHRYSVANSPAFPRLIPAYFLLNARFSVLRGPAEYALFVKNMGGAHPNLSDELSQAAEDPGRPRWTEGPPTSYGIEMRVTF